MLSRDSITNNNDECVNCPGKNISELTNKENAIQFSHLNSIHLKEDEIKNYSDKLEWGINNNEVRNIAITGSYGSGKSSIIKSFIKNKKLEEKSLSISFANFENDDKLIKKEEIEFNIVNQILYSEKKSKLRNSRFKRITNKSEKEKILTIAFLLLFIYTVINIFFPSLNNKISIFPYCEFQKYFFIPLFIIQTFYILYHIYDDVINFRITKISPTDIQITNENKELTESILNKYYDEILNFFLVSDIEIVFIEDLDRYEGSVSIFTHLRQINEQLNNSKDLDNKKITFVYAVKDDLLKDEHTKTKFFDLIIPILPFINSNTSREFIITKLKELDNDILDNNPNIKNLIKEISPYINDTRTALNIKNEFIIFKDQYISNWEKNNPDEKDKLISSSPYDKILAIVVYKNLFAKDYVNLLCNSFDSLVYSIFYYKEEFLKNSISEKETRIKEIDDEIKKFKTSHIPDIESLNKIMINSLIILLVEKDISLNSIEINKERITLRNLHIDENFKTLKENIKYRKNNWSEFTNTNISFQQLVESSGIDYNKEYDKIKSISEGIIERLQKEKLELNKEISIIKSKSISDLIKRISDSEIFEKSKFKIEQKDGEKVDREALLYELKLLFILVKNGYLNEQYLNYISHKHEGLLDFEDIRFRNKIIDNIEPDFNYKIKNIEDFMDDISQSHFNSKTIFNYSILNFLLKNFDKHNDEINLFYDNLFTNENYQKDFIIGAFANLDEKYVFKFYHKVIYKKAFWKNIVDNKEITNQIILNILKESNPDKLLSQLNSEDKLLEYLKENENILKDISAEQLELLHTNISFKISDLNNITKFEVQEFIYKNNLYHINETNLEIINTKINEINIPEWKISNLSKLYNEPLDDYLYYNINEFLDVLYYPKIKKEENGQSVINWILTNENVKDVYRYIKEIEFVLDSLNIDITVIDFDKSLFKPLLEFQRIKPSWYNIKIIYSITGLTNELIAFINLNKNILEHDQDLSIDNDDELICEIIKSNKIEEFKIFDATDIEFEEIDDYVDFTKFIEYIIDTKRVELNTEIFNVINNENKLHFINQYIRQDLDLDELEIEAKVYAKLIIESEDQISKFLIGYILNDFNKIDFEEEAIISLISDYIIENNSNVDFNILDKLMYYIDEESVKLNLISIKFKLSPHLAEDDVIELLKHTSTFEAIEEKENYKVELNDVNNEILNYLKSKKIIKHHYSNNTENKYTITF